MKKVLVIGSNGQLGRCLADRYNTYQTHFISTSDREIDLDYKFVDIETVDITKAESIDDLFSDYRPDYVVNCAAYTNVPKAETDQRTAYHVNEIGPGNLARACKSYDAKLIHISTDYVYNVNGLIDETTSLTEPLNIYGRSKLLGDLSVLDENEENSIILRTAWLYSAYGTNFMKTMLNLFDKGVNSTKKNEIKVVCDQIGSPTSADSLANVIFKIIKKSIETNTFEYGIYNCTDEGFISWYDFTQAILDEKQSYSGILQTNNDIIPISTDEFNSDQLKNGKQIVKRPMISLMNKAKIKKTFDIKLPYWRYSLIFTMHKYLSNTQN